MSQNSKIEWTNHTFNPWWGCVKVSQGCKNCYAEVLDNRYNHEKPHWGANSNRKPMSETYWNQPLKWNKEAAEKGIKEKIFCASMADVFEDHPQVGDYRERLFCLIEKTPNLIWQLLTKRPENIMKMLPDRWLNNVLPQNLWLGVSVENEQAANERMPLLLQVPAAVRFLSCEPLLGEIILPLFEINDRKSVYGHKYFYELLDWVIVGGESGHSARPLHPDWARSLRDQCNAADVPFFFKQWGEWKPVSTVDGKQILPFGSYCTESKFGFVKAGKKKAGRLLDSKEHNEFPITK